MIRQLFGVSFKVKCIAAPYINNRLYRFPNGIVKIGDICSVICITGSRFPNGGYYIVEYPAISINNDVEWPWTPEIFERI